MQHNYCLCVVKQLPVPRSARYPVISLLPASYKVAVYTICLSGRSCLWSVLLQVKNESSTITNKFLIWFLILKISNYFLHLRIHLRLSTILKTSNKMVFEMVFQMVFIPNICTVKINDKNSIKQKTTRIQNELVQHNLNLDLLDQSGTNQKIFLLNIF